MKRILFFYVSLFLFAQNTQGQVSFAPPDTLEYTTASEFATYLNENVFSTDFNNDEFDDILILRGNSIFLRTNTGDGAFAEETLVYEDKNHIVSISNLLDLNNDTYSDMVVATSKDLKVVVSGNNKYSKAHEAVNVVSSGKLALFDYNKDSKMDLVFTNENEVFGFSNIGNGFTTRSTLYTNQDGPIHSFEILDLNLDTHPDLIISGYSTKFKVLFGNVGQTFTTVFSKDLKSIVSLEIGDLNLDGFKDISYLEWNYNLNTLIYNNASRTYTDQAVFSEGSLPSNLFSFKLTDLKGNGTLDLVYNRFFGLRYRENNGMGQFLAEEDLLDNLFLPYSFKQINLDDDGLNDILLSDYEKFQVISFTTNGLLKTEIADSYLSNYRDGLFQDVDGDGFKDIVSVSRTGYLYVRWGNTNHDYSSYKRYSIPFHADNATVSDINNDGNLDVLIGVESTSNSIGKIVMVEGKGNREFKEARDWRYLSKPGKGEILDVDKDGRMDFLTYGRFENVVLWMDCESTDLNEYMLPNRKVEIEGNGIMALAHDDIDNDGYVDIMTANFLSKNVTILKNNRVGSFTETTLTPHGEVSGVFSVKSFDYNGDQYKDLLVVIESSSNVDALQVFLNDKQGNFTHHLTTNLNDMYQARYIDVLDVDGDSDLDFIISAWDYLSENVLINENGLFTNTEKEVIKKHNQLSRVYGDFNVDGKVDVFTGSFYGNTFIQLNNSVLEPEQTNAEITVEEIGLKSVKINLSPVSSSGRLVVLTKGTELSTRPDDSRFYSSNLIFGIGSALSAESYVVHVGKEESLEITGLSTSTHYLISVFDYNVNSPQVTIINYTEDKKQISFNTLNSPPQISSISNQTGINLETINIPLVISDEDNQAHEFSFEFSSSNEDVVPGGNVKVVFVDEQPILVLQPIAEGESLIEVVVRDTGDNSAKVTFKYISLIVGITDERASDFSVFPNPFRSVVGINSLNRTRSFVVCNATGHLILQFESIPELLDLSTIPPGLYFFKTSDGKYSKAVKY